MKTSMVLGITFLLVSTVTFAQEWSGLYECKVEKDGYKVLLEAKFQESGDEYLGQLKATGNSSFDIEIWGIKNGGFIDFYYGSGGDKTFSIPNAHLFTISGSPSEPSTSFGTGIEDAVKYIHESTGFFQQGKLPAVKTTSVIPPPPKNVSKATVAKKIDTQGKSKGELLIGKWSGDPATATTKFFDYNFIKDGTGMRGGQTFYWDLEEDKITITWIEPIDMSRYNQLMGQAENVRFMEDHQIVSTPSRTYKVVNKNKRYGIMGKREILKISRIDGGKLTLVARNAADKAVMTYHTRQ